MTTILFQVVAALRRINSGYYFFTSAIGGQTPCWSPLSSTASLPPLTRAVAAYDAITTSGSVNGGDDGPNEDDSTPTSAVNNVVFSLHYPVDDPKALSLGGYIGIALGISVTVSTTFAVILWFLLRRRKQKTARLRRAMQQADNDNYPGIWDGPSHGSDEQLFQVPPQELATFGQNGKPTAVDRMAASRTRTNSSGYAAQEAQHFQQSFGFHAVGTHGQDNSGRMNNDFTPGFPLAVHVPPRVSSAAAAGGGYSSLPPITPISSTRSQLPPIKRDGNPWGAHGVESEGGLDSKGGKPKGGKEEEALQNAGGASQGAAGSSSSHNGNQRQRQSQHPAELAEHPVAVPDGHGSGYGLDGVEGDHDEPPPEYREF
ncbi:hypothetical protein N0V85_005232 [Neurospora sp. IMI 360204]|nr:hypothetical protein N0V85_005232 [Neurospora sp. IMI 360204]